MAVHFYKLQCGGNSFVLLDLTESTNKDQIPQERFPSVAARLSSRRYGIGAVATIFLQQNNFIRVFDRRGIEHNTHHDAFLCCCRYLFDCGKNNGTNIEISSPGNQISIPILGSREFALNLGSPFSMESGMLITQNSEKIISYIYSQDSTISATAIHLIEDSICAFQANAGTLSYEQFRSKIQNALNQTKVNSVLLKPLTQDTLAIRTSPTNTSSVCASAGAGLVSGVIAGTTAHESIILFNTELFNGEGYNLNSDFSPQGQEFGVSWNETTNEITISGSGAYIFDGTFDLPKLN